MIPSFQIGGEQQISPKRDYAAGFGGISTSSLSNLNTSKIDLPSNRDVPRANHSVLDNYQSIMQGSKSTTTTTSNLRADIQKLKDEHLKMNMTRQALLSTQSKLKLAASKEQ